MENTSFVRVDADVIDKIIKKEDAMPSKLSEKEQDTLKPIVEGIVTKEPFLCTPWSQFLLKIGRPCII